MNDRRRVRTALVILTAHNLVQNSLLNERGYVSGNLVVSGLLVGVGPAGYDHRASSHCWDSDGQADLAQQPPDEVRADHREGHRVDRAGPGRPR